MQKLFQKVLDTYLGSPKKVDSRSDIYRTLVRDLPEQIERSLLVFDDHKDLIVKGSMGNGNKTDWPWIAVMNRNITSTTQEGLYICYLFRKDMSGFYLTLTQGITHFQKAYSGTAMKAAERVAQYFQDEIKSGVFDKTPISLSPGSKSHSGRGYGYEKATIIGKGYRSHGFTDSELIDDLSEAHDIYEDLLHHFQTHSYEDVIKSVLEYDDFSKKQHMVEGNEAHKEIVTALDPDGDITYSPTASLKEVQPFVDRSDRYRRITNPINTKIDYLKKAQFDAKIGLLGEELVLDYERERLKKLGDDLGYDVEEFIEKIQWVSIKSDSFGYDIQSYDFIDGRFQPIQIEVKSTASKIDIPFPVSRGEVERSKVSPDTYFVYRLYDVRSSEPKFYRVRGTIEDNFELDPITYMARYKLPSKA